MLYLQSCSAGISASDECVRRHRRTKEVLIKSGAQIAPQIFRQIVQ